MRLLEKNQTWLEKNGLTSAEWELTSTHLLVSSAGGFPCWSSIKDKNPFILWIFRCAPPCTYLPLNSISTNPLEISVCPSLSNQLLAFSVLEGKWGVLIRFIMRNHLILQQIDPTYEVATARRISLLPKDWGQFWIDLWWYSNPLLNQCTMPKHL